MKMKKIFILLFMFVAVYGYSQKVPDATIKTYGDTYLNTNATGSITGAQLNTYLNYMISSKVNHDSATIVRIATTKDTLFITYWGFAEDTIPILTSADDSAYFDLVGTKLRTKTGIGYLIADTISAGNNSPDSLLHSEGGGNFETDILVGGGWAAFTPTITWTGGTPSTPPTVTARYSVTNNTVEFDIYIRGENDSGSALTGIEITPPIYPPDINSFCNIDLCMGATTVPDATNTRYTTLLDMNDGTESNRTISSMTAFNIPNEDYYNIVINGSYEITNRFP